jgi:choline kinase
MNIVILGDKYQKGMKSRGCIGLLPYNNSNNLIQHQYGVLSSIFPQCQIAYVYGFDQKRICSFFKKNPRKNLTPIFNSKHELYNVCFSLSICKDLFGEDTLIVNGGLKLTKKIFKKFNTDLGSQVFVNKKYHNDIGCIIENKNIKNISFNLTNYIYDIYYISKNNIELFKELIIDKQNYNCFMFEIINKIIDSEIAVRPHHIELESSTKIACK